MVAASPSSGTLVMIWGINFGDTLGSTEPVIKRNKRLVEFLLGYFTTKFCWKFFLVNYSKHMCCGRNSDWFLVAGDAHQPNSFFVFEYPL